ncbi:hypothetical protein D8770_25000 [Methylobacterium sp. DB1607]|nr:hypothetical protein [Methylobacterium sp. DB1607]
MAHLTYQMLDCAGVWEVHAPDGTRQSFPDKERALRAALTGARTAMAQGHTVNLLVETMTEGSPSPSNLGPNVH